MLSDLYLVIDTSFSIQQHDCMTFVLLVLILTKLWCLSHFDSIFLMQEEGASNLAMDLQKQIDETLEEITPRCVLELLALPLDEEHRVKRVEGLQGVRNILWAVGGGGAAAIAGGFTREDFMNEAFMHMTAAEQVSLDHTYKSCFNLTIFFLLFSQLCTLFSFLCH